MPASSRGGGLAQAAPLMQAAIAGPMSLGSASRDSIVRPGATVLAEHGAGTMGVHLASRIRH